MTALISRIGAWVIAALVLAASGAALAQVPQGNNQSDTWVGAQAIVRPGSDYWPPGEHVPYDDECCSDPGQASECWWTDALDDGVACTLGEMCSAGECVDVGDPDQGLCPCADDDDCGEGVCDEVNEVCGPSWCNGYLVCSCWGGCEPAVLGGYANPEAMCSDTDNGYPGFCCDGSYPTDSEGMGYCSDDPTCNEGCTEDADCVDDNPCTYDQCVNFGCINEYLNATVSEIAADPDLGGVGQAAIITAQCPFPADYSSDCAERRCLFGMCDVAVMNTGELCADNVLPPPAPLTWDPQCWDNRCDSGSCEVTQAAVGTPCDDANACSEASACDENAQCVATEPQDPPLGDCCDDAIAASFDDGNNCTSDYCDDTFHDGHFDLAVDTSCADGAAFVDDLCGVWSCQYVGLDITCLEDTASYVGNACGAVTTCLEWICSSVVGQEGDCVSNTINENGACDWLNPPDSCGPMTCQGGICDFSVPVGTTPCAPAVGPVDPCCEYECSVDHECVPVNCADVDPLLEECDGGYMGIAIPPLGTNLNESADNKCTEDDYDVSTAGLFDKCDFPDDSETVHYFQEQTHPTEYQLRHSLVEVDGDGTWDPLVYTATSCYDSGAGPDTQPDQHTCNNDCDFADTNLLTGCDNVDATDSVVTTGPWPLKDYPTSSLAAHYSTTNSYETSVFVDSRPTTLPAGGPYDLDVTVEAHSNNSCFNTAEYIAAPRIEGQISWKDRWRGNLNGYTNYFATVGAGPAPYCWGGGAPAADDPKTAFFRVDLPDGTVAQSTGTTSWDHSYKIYSDPRGIDEMPTTLSWWGSNTPDGDCSGSLFSPQGCRNPPKAAPREFIVRAGDALRGGWVALSNADPGDDDDYELNVLRVPREFLGMHQTFVGPGDGVGCGCDPPANTEQVFNLMGYRLDFIPINDDVSGYAVRKTWVGSGNWLVPGGPHPLCGGEDCANPDPNDVRDFLFQFPFAGDFYPKFCVDTAGRILLSKGGGDCENTYDPAPSTAKFVETGAPSIAPLWGTIIPGTKVDYPDCDFFGWEDNGDVKCLYNTVPFVCALGCEVWAWKEENMKGKGFIREKFSSFEGVSAMVITWEEWDGYFNPLNGGSNHGIEFQVIMRADGRITFFYRIPNGPAGASVWEDILNSNGWTIGISGGRSQPCAFDGECDTFFDTAGLMCDTETITVNGEDVWEASNLCLNPVDFQQAGAEVVPGTWQGE